MTRPEPRPTTICPHCGYSLLQDELVTRGEWMLSPQYTFYAGRLINLSGAKRQLLYALARSFPRSMGTDALCQRTSYSYDLNTMTTQICQLRRSLREMGLPVPVSTVIGGYIWSDTHVDMSEYRRGGGKVRSTRR